MSTQRRPHRKRKIRCRLRPIRGAVERVPLRKRELRDERRIFPGGKRAVKRRERTIGPPELDLELRDHELALRHARVQRDGQLRGVERLLHLALRSQLLGV